MATELVYTSAPAGLKPGTYGFCVVACTRGLKESYTTALLPLSGYRRIYSSESGSGRRNPVVYANYIVDVGGIPRRVLSRVADAGYDYTNRTNKIASHLILSNHELPRSGPASLFAVPNLFVESWNSKPVYFEQERQIPTPPEVPLNGAYWKATTGDSRWARALAATVSTKRSVFLIVRPDRDVLRLYREAIELLPTTQRWDATFSTYFTSLPPGVSCQWKAVVAGSPEEEQARSGRDAFVIDLSVPGRLGALENFVAAIPTWNTWNQTPKTTEQRQAPIKSNVVAARDSATPAKQTRDSQPIYALRAEDVLTPCVPKEAKPIRKKLNYGRDAVLTTDVPLKKSNNYAAISAISVGVLLFIALIGAVVFGVGRVATHSNRIQDASSAQGNGSQADMDDANSEKKQPTQENATDSSGDASVATETDNSEASTNESASDDGSNSADNELGKSDEKAASEPKESPSDSVATDDANKTSATGEPASTDNTPNDNSTSANNGGTEDAEELKNPESEGNTLDPETPADDAETGEEPSGTDDSQNAEPQEDNATSEPVENEDETDSFSSTEQKEVEKGELQAIKIAFDKFLTDWNLYGARYIKFTQDKGDGQKQDKGNGQITKKIVGNYQESLKNLSEACRQNGCSLAISVRLLDLSYYFVDEGKTKNESSQTFTPEESGKLEDESVVFQFKKEKPNKDKNDELSTIKFIVNDDKDGLLTIEFSDKDIYTFFLLYGQIGWNVFNKGEEQQSNNYASLLQYDKKGFGEFIKQNNGDSARYEIDLSDIYKGMRTKPKLACPAQFNKSPTTQINDCSLMVDIQSLSKPLEFKEKVKKDEYVFDWEPLEKKSWQVKLTLDQKKEKLFVDIIPPKDDQDNSPELFKKVDDLIRKDWNMNIYIGSGKEEEKWTHLTVVQEKDVPDKEADNSK